MNKSLFLIFLLLALVLPNVTALGLAMPPTKTFDAFIGKPFYIDVMIMNQEGMKMNYSITFEGSSKEYTTATPSSAVVYPPLDVVHRGVPAQDGFAAIKIYINSTELTPGKYNLDVIASTSRDGGALTVIQQVRRNIEVNYVYPPSLFNRIMNFIYTQSKKITNWIIAKLVQFYEKNQWLNYLFFAIILTIVFYVGVNINKIIRYFRKKRFAIHKEKERIGKRGFWAWISKKFKDTFKKTKQPESNREKELKDGQKDIEDRFEN